MLIADDVADEALLAALDSRGIAVTVVTDGARALIEVGRLAPSALLVSATLPVVDGVTVVRAVRDLADHVDVCILLAVGVDDHRQAAAGLAAGASACVGKPYRVNEVLALVGATPLGPSPAWAGVGGGAAGVAGVAGAAVAGSAGAAGGFAAGGGVGARDGVLRVGEVTLDVGAYEVRVGGVPVRLPPQEFRLLRVLLERAGLVVTRETLLEQVWGGRDTETNTLAVHVRRLRRRLGHAGHAGQTGDAGDPSDSSSQLIESVRGVGYRFRLAQAPAES